MATYDGNNKANTYTGGTEADLISGNDGNDTLSGGDNNDTIFGGSGSDVIDGGNHNDALDGGVGADRLTGGSGDDTFHLTGTFGSDTIVGGEAGESAGDTIDISSATSGVTVTYSGADTGTITDGSSTASFSEIENFTLSGQNDTFNGATATNGVNVSSGFGTDTLTGGSGNDTMTAGVGSDSVTGGAGNDLLTGSSTTATSGGAGQVNWTSLGNGTSVTGGATLTSSGVQIGVSYTDTGAGTSATVSNTTQYVAGGETFSNASSLWLVGDGSGPTSTTTLNFSAAAGSLMDGTASNVSFRLNDIDRSAWQDVVTVLAYDADGNLVPVTITSASSGANADTISGGTITAGNQQDEANLAGGSALVTIAGPISRIEIVYSNGLNSQQYLYITDVQFTTTYADNDTLVGGVGNDTAYGGVGNDSITGDANNDLLYGGDGKDTISGGADQDTVYGDAGNDSLTGDAGNDSIFGGTGNDSIYGGSEQDTLSGDAGNDLIFGGDGNDQLAGGADNDTLSGDAGDDSLSGDVGNDSLLGGTGNDLLYGGDGNDTLSGGADQDTVYGDAGNDSLTGDAGNDSLYGGSGNDTVDGGTGNDRVDGGTGNDSLLGGDGDDTFILATGFGTDTINGNEAGETTGDTLDLSGIALGVNVTLTGAEAGTVVSGTDSATFSNIEHLILTAGNDSLDATALAVGIAMDGLAGDDTLRGGSGNDSFIGGAGNDSLIGGIGNDALYGDAGNDTLHGDAGHDSLAGDAGNDLLYGGTGNDTLAGGADNDQLYGGDNEDLLEGGTGNDSLYGDAGNDVLEGGDGNDSLFGGAGNDTLYGGAGDESFAVEAGNDVLDGGTGNDRFDGGLGDTVNGGENLGDYDQLDLTAWGWSLTNVIHDPMNPENGVVQFLDASGAVIGSMAFSNIEKVVTCFTPGTLIATARGPEAVERLVPGDLIMTRDHGLQPLRWVGRRDLSLADLIAGPKLQPVRIAAGALGAGLPLRDMLVSPQHRMLMTGARAEMLFGEDEVLVAALHLTALPGVEQVLTRGVTYLHLMFDNHEVIEADGAWSESFQPAARSLRDLGDEQRAEIVALFPDLAGGPVSVPAARLTLKAHEARVLLAA